MKVKETNFSTDVDILFNLDPYTARPIMVSDNGVTANSEGKKIVKAGTLLDKDGVSKNDGTVRYVLLKDVDVTFGKAPGAGLYRGTVDKDKIKSYANVTISKAAEVALKGVIFMSKADYDYVVKEA